MHHHQNPIIGHVVRWEFSDGPTKGQAYEHEFHLDGTVDYRQAGAKTSEKAKRYQTEQVGHSVFAVSYVAPSGWTLTSVLDCDTGTLVAFASKGGDLVVQHGTFEVLQKNAA